MCPSLRHPVGDDGLRIDREPAALRRRQSPRIGQLAHEARVAAGGVAYGITMFRSYRSTGGFEEKHHQIQQLEHENLELQREIENERVKLKRLEDPDELAIWARKASILPITRHIK